MPDGNAPGVGHNNPPEGFDELKAKVNDFGVAAKTWGEKGIKSDADADAAKDFQDGARQLYKDLEAARKAEKKPHDDAATAVQEKYRPLTTLISQVGGAIGELINAHLQKKQAELDAQRAKEAAIAREKAEMARRDAEAAAAKGDVVAAAQIEQDVKKAEKAAAKAAKPTRARVGGSTGSAATIRKTRVVEVEKPDLLIAHYRKNPSLIAEAIRLANADVWASKGAKIEIPGCKIVTKEGV